ncbi:hypothetical protein GCM10009525_79320 [Streptosporangium amethystogenes subsp. fukuiense]
MLGVRLHDQEDDQGDGPQTRTREDRELVVGLQRLQIREAWLVHALQTRRRGRRVRKTDYVKARIHLETITIGDQVFPEGGLAVTLRE